MRILSMQENISENLIRDLIKEKRSERRWKNTRFFLGFIVVIIVLSAIFSGAHEPASKINGKNGYVSLVRLDGMIGPGEYFSAENVIPLLKEAFEDKDAKGVVIDIDSGGGTPVQASIIHDAIDYLKKRHHKKVVVVGEDMLASGAYYVAVAADKIYVNPNTITGSIGVIMKGFGFPDAIHKLGIERRVITAGANKDRLDPFLPQTTEDVAKIRQVIGEVHQNFIQVVQAGRKGKLHADPRELFSGDFWSGETALKLGLVDGLGNLSDVVQDEFHASGYKDYSDSHSMLKALLSQMGTSLGASLNHHQAELLSLL